MVSSLIDLSSTTMPRYIQQNLIAYSGIFSGLPGVVTVSDAEVFWFVSHTPAPGNIILRTAFDGEIDTKIDALIETIGTHLDEIAWFVFPHDRPADLGTRLESRGMSAGRGGNWLWADLTALCPAPEVENGFHIERVQDDTAMAEWLRLSEAGFGGKYPIFYDANARHGYGGDALSLHYLGYLGDTPVTSGTLLDASGTASIYDVSTPPEFRGCGFGGALTHFMMREIRDRGYGQTFIWSSGMAQTLYRKLGYVDAEFGLREHIWRKNAVN